MESVILIKLLCNFIEFALWHGRSPANLLHFFRTLFLKNTSEGLLLLLKNFKVSVKIFMYNLQIKNLVLVLYIVKIPNFY